MEPMEEIRVLMEAKNAMAVAFRNDVPFWARSKVQHAQNYLDAQASQIAADLCADDSAEPESV
jgi:hypothetical protein